MEGFRGSHCFPLCQVFEEPPEATEAIEAEEFVEVTEEAREHGEFQCGDLIMIFVQLLKCYSSREPSHYPFPAGTET